MVVAVLDAVVVLVLYVAELSCLTNKQDRSLSRLLREAIFISHHMNHEFIHTEYTYFECCITLESLITLYNILFIKLKNSIQDVEQTFSYLLIVAMSGFLMVGPTNLC